MYNTKKFPPFFRKSYYMLSLPFMPNLFLFLVHHDVLGDVLQYKSWNEYFQLMVTLSALLHCTGQNVRTLCFIYEHQLFQGLQYRCTKNVIYLLHDQKFSVLTMSYINARAIYKCYIILQNMCHYLFLGLPHTHFHQPMAKIDWPTACYAGCWKFKNGNMHMFYIKLFISDRLKVERLATVTRSNIKTHLNQKVRTVFSLCKGCHNKHFATSFSWNS